jgi:hypothetical protein
VRSQGHCTVGTPGPLHRISPMLTWNSLSIASLGSSLMRGLFVMFLALRMEHMEAQQQRQGDCVTAKTTSQ